MTWNDKIGTQEQDQRTYENTAEARRVTQVDKTGTLIDDSNPLPTTQQLKIDTVIEDTAFDLNASVYDESDTPTYDYIIDNVTFDFTTAESRTITITSDNGTEIYKATNTNLSVAIGSINFGQASGQSFRIQITQTAGACSVDVTAQIKNSPVALTADPVIAAGTNVIGRVNSESEFYMNISQRKIPGHTHINKFGHNHSATTGDDVWGGGGVYGFYPTAAVNVDIVSTSISDDTGGVGAIQVLVKGLDSNWDEQEELITLNGTGVVQMTKTFIRLFRAFVYEAGTSNSNAGNITVYARSTGSGLTAGDVGIYIGAGDGQTLHCIYTIPNGKTGYFIKGYVGLSNTDKNGQDGAFRWLMRLNNGLNGAWLTQGEVGLVNIGSSYWQYKYGVPAGEIPEKTDIRINLVSASDTMDTVGGFDIVLVEDGY